MKYLFLIHNKGFTLIELIMVITIVGILAISVAVRWPTGLEDEAAIKEFIRAFRYAQHQAMTREYDPADITQAWGIFRTGDQYTIRQNDGTSAIPEYTNRNLLDDAANTLTGPDIIFNGLGEPMDTAGNQLAADDTYTVNGITVTVCSETGFVARGACP